MDHRTLQTLRYHLDGLERGDYSAVAYSIGVVGWTLSTFRVGVIDYEHYYGRGVESYEVVYATRQWEECKRDYEARVVEGVKAYRGLEGLGLGSRILGYTVIRKTRTV